VIHIEIQLNIVPNHSRTM